MCIRDREREREITFLAFLSNPQVLDKFHHVFWFPYSSHLLDTDFLHYFPVSDVITVERSCYWLSARSPHAFVIQRPARRRLALYCTLFVHTVLPTPDIFISNVIDSGYSARLGIIFISLPKASSTAPNTCAFYIFSFFTR